MILLSALSVAGAGVRAAAPQNVVPFDIAKRHTYQLQLVNRPGDACQGQVDTAAASYQLTVEPQPGHAILRIKKRADSYTRAALLSVEEVTSTNALDFATFALYPDGSFKLLDRQANIAAYRAEKAEIAPTLAGDPKYFSAQIALGLAMRYFEGSLEAKMMQRYGVLFDIGQFKNLRAASEAELAPGIFSYVTLPQFPYSGRYSARAGKLLEVNAELRRAEFKPGGVCDPALLAKLDPGAPFTSEEIAICRRGEVITTTYRYAEAERALHSIERRVLSTKDGERTVQLCQSVKVR